MSVDEAIRIAAEHFIKQNGTGEIKRLCTSKNTILAVPKETYINALKISRQTGQLQMVDR